MIENKKAYFNYQILEEYEFGMQLLGLLIKEIRAGRINIIGSYVRILFNKQGAPELWLVGANFSRLTDQASIKLLAHKQEIVRLTIKLHEKGLTLVPLKIYFKQGRAKLLAGLGRGKKQYDKRAAIKERDIKRKISRAMHSRE